MKAVIILSFVFFTGTLWSQTENRPGGKWQAQSNFGASISLTKLKTGALTDQLIDYDNHYFYWQYLTLNYYVRPNWGLNFSIQGHQFTDPDRRGLKMNTALADQFGSRYFIDNSPYSFGETLSVNTNIYLGAFFRKNFNRFYLLPKFQIGATSFNTRRLNVSLKEKNTNQYVQLIYQTDQDQVVNDYLTVMLGSILAYHLTDQISIEFNLQTYIFRTNFSYEIIQRNTFTDASSSHFFNYEKWISSLSFGLGLAYQFDRQ